MIIVRSVKVSDLSAAVVFVFSSSAWQVMWRHWPVAEPQTVDVFCTARLINLSETHWQAVRTLQCVITVSVSKALQPSPDIPVAARSFFRQSRTYELICHLNIQQ
jgi:hypothetical protein